MSYYGTGFEIGKRISRTQLRDLLTTYAMAEGVASGRDYADKVALRTIEFYEDLISEEMK